MNNLNLDELNERVEARLTQQKKVIPMAMFGVSVLLVVLFTVIGGITYAEGATEAAFVMVMMSGIMALMMHMFGVLFGSSLLDKNTRAQLTTRVMSEMLSEYVTDKRKTRPSRLDESDPSDEEAQDGEIVMLGDDGELKRERRS